MALGGESARARNLTGVSVDTAPRVARVASLARQENQQTQSWPARPTCVVRQMQGNLFAGEGRIC